MAKKDVRPEIKEEQDAQIAHDALEAQDTTPTEKPTPVTKRDGTSDPSPGTEPEVEPHPTVVEADLDAQIAALQKKKAALAPPPDHRTLYGSEAIVDPNGEKSYHAWVDGRRYVHVGEHNGEWVYRPD